MPIYAYRCTSCGFEKDVMRKVSDPLLTLCPECNTENFAKQLTAPGFQLKGSGWYATDFKGGSTSKPAAASDSTAAAAVPPCQGGTGVCPSCT
jgi:putative FmdB family regulatory protein